MAQLAQSDPAAWVAENQRRQSIAAVLGQLDQQIAYERQAIEQRKAQEMQQKGQIKGTPYVQFVMGVKNAMPADRDVFDYYIRTVHRLFGPDAPWCAAGIGPQQIVLNDWAVASGGHARTGLEDNVRLDRDRLAPSNAALVRRVVEICNRYDRPVASWREARDILGLRQPAG